MQTLFLCLVLFVVVALGARSLPPAPAPEYVEKFNGYIADFGKSYASPDEYQNRYRNYVINLQEINEHNKRNPNATFGHTPFTDWSKEEFLNLLTVTAPTKRDLQNLPEKDFSRPSQPHPIFTRGKRANPDPTNWDWSQAGVITPVYNQNQCGCCWAFSTAETVESYYALAGNPLTQLSMQQLVDCDTVDQGCGGGNPLNAYGYIKNAGGLDSYASYPFSSGGGTPGSCQFNQNNVVTTISDCSSITGEDALYQQLSSPSGGPVSVLVDASTWQNYQGGILTSCGSNIDHAVQVTGYYNYGQSGAYWNVRNQWSTSWGVNGYIQIAIGQNLCAIGDYGSIVTI